MNRASHMKVIFGDLARQLILNQPKNVVDYMVGENPTCLRNITLIDATRYSLVLLLVQLPSGHGWKINYSRLVVACYDFAKSSFKL